MRDSIWFNRFLRAGFFSALLLILTVAGGAARNDASVSPWTDLNTDAATLQTWPTPGVPERSWPNDTNDYVRAIVPNDYARAVVPDETGLALPGVLLRDVVVSNSDPTLTNTDTANDGETTIAINPANPDEIVISAFSGGWGANAPIYHSTDGGLTWAREFSVPVPPGWPSGCPCDWAFDYGRANLLSGTILARSPTVAGGNDVVSGTTINPALSASWNYFDPAGPPVQAQETNINWAGSLGNADQPWLLVNRDPTNAAQDNVYVAYDDFNNSDGVDGQDMRVAVSYGVNPPNFTVDRPAGNATGGVNPGLRMADDPRTGIMWVLWQRNTAGGADPKNIDYMLNRSTDGGATWTLNASATGIIVANADSTQPQPKFGTVNALLGGVLHAGVDPTTGDLYYVYGNRDAGTGNNRLAIRRVTANGSGGVIIDPQHFVTGQVQAAIPSVAVTANGTLGVFYYTFDGFSSDSFPIFTAHLAISYDKGVSFEDTTLLTFLSSAQDNSDPRQRVLGDYMQTKAVDSCFYGSFTGNGAPLGRPISNHDPLFFKVCTGPQLTPTADLELIKFASPNPVVAGTDLSYTLIMTNTGPSAAVNVVIEDVVPAGVTINSVSAVGGTCNAGVPGNAALPTKCTFNTVASGGVRAMLVGVKVLPQTRGVLGNNAVVYSDTFDPDNSDNLATVAVNVIGQATLTVTKTYSPDPVVAGTKLTYEVIITNTGPSTATGVTLTDTFPAGVTYLNYTVSNGSGTCTLAPPNPLNCDLNNLNPGQYVRVVFVVMVAAGVPDGTVLTNTATADSLESPAISASANTNVIAQADLKILKDANFLTVNPAPRIQYVLTITNLGPSDALAVGVVDELPLDPKKIVYVMDSGNGACAYNKPLHDVICSFGTLKAGQSLTLYIVVDVRGSVRVIRNKATVSSTTVDPLEANNLVYKDVRIKGGPGTGISTGGSTETQVESVRRSYRERVFVSKFGR